MRARWCVPVEDWVKSLSVKCWHTCCDALWRSWIETSWVAPCFPSISTENLLYHLAPTLTFKYPHIQMYRILSVIKCPSFCQTYIEEMGFTEPHTVTPTKTFRGSAAACTRLLYLLSGFCDFWSKLRRRRPSLSNTAGDLQQNNMVVEFVCLFWLYYFFRKVLTSYFLPELVDNVSWQNVNEENGQADVE